MYMINGVAADHVAELARVWRVFYIFLAFSFRVLSPHSPVRGRVKAFFRGEYCRSDVSYVPSLMH